MSRLRPFRALRFNLEKIRDLASVISPPFDTISREKRAELRARHPNNAIRLILGDPSTFPPHEQKDRRRYARAAETLRRWRNERILVPEAGPSYYVVEETFEFRGASRRRRGVLATLRLEELGEGSVLPHEKTVSGPIEDRFRLTQAVKAHLSPVFVLAECRPAPALLERACAFPPLLSFRNPDEPVSCRAWRVDSGEIAGAISDAFGEGPFLIADGHHRYTTALRYARENASDHPEAGFMLVYVVAVPDPAVVLDSIQRLYLTEIPLRRVLERLGESGTVRLLEPTWEAFLASGAPFGVVEAGANRFHAFEPSAAALARIDAPWRDVPTLLLAEFVGRRILGTEEGSPEARPSVRYVQDPAALAGEARGPGRLGFWLRPLSASTVLRVARSRLTLPPKSTFFYPKIPTGIVFHPFD